MSTIRTLRRHLLKQVRRSISTTPDLASSPPTRQWQWVTLLRRRLSKPILISQLLDQGRRYLSTLTQDQRRPRTALNLHGLSLYPTGNQLLNQPLLTLSNRTSNPLPPVLLNRLNRGNCRAHMQHGTRSITPCKTKWE
jgi:hypothetical protein